MHTLSLTLHLVKLHAEIPSSLNESDFMNNPTQAGGSWGLINGYEEYLKLLSGIRLESKLSRNLKNNITLFSTTTDPCERRPFNTLDDRHQLNFIASIRVLGKPNGDVLQGHLSASLVHLSP